MNESKEQIFDIYDIWYEPLLSQAWFVVTLILFLSIIIGLVLYFIYTRFYKVVKKIDPLVFIQQKLTDINYRTIENEYDSKKAYFEMTELLKQYISYRYHISVVGLTDPELLQWAAINLSQEQIIILEQIFVHTDVIKFEHQLATAEQVKKSIELVQAFIHSAKEA